MNGKKADGEKTSQILDIFLQILDFHQSFNEFRQHIRI